MMLSRFVLALIVLSTAFAQNPPSATVDLSHAEKQFQDVLANVTLTGYYVQGDNSQLHEDRYVIERVSKVKDDLWKFEARIQYNKQDMKVAMSFPVKFAGDTPVISLTNFTVPGFGAFTARVVIYDGTFGIPCGGTHVQNLRSIGHLMITKIKSKKGLTKVSYSVDGMS